MYGNVTRVMLMIFFVLAAGCALVLITSSIGAGLEALRQIDEAADAGGTWCC